MAGRPVRAIALTDGQSITSPTTKNKRQMLAKNTATTSAGLKLGVSVWKASTKPLQTRPPDDPGRALARDRRGEEVHGSGGGEQPDAGDRHPIGTATVRHRRDDDHRHRRGKRRLADADAEAADRQGGDLQLNASA